MLTDFPLVMVIEDHDELRAATVAALKKHGYRVLSASSAEEVDERVLQEPVDLYIVDLNLPAEDGLSLSRRLRAAYPGAGIVMTTARTSLKDRVSGYQSGADLYLPKPVALEELLAAIHSLTLRMQAKQEGEEAGWFLDFKTLRLIGPAGEARLSNAEGRLLAALAAAPGLSLERWQVVSQLVGADVELSANSLQVRISSLRKKLTECGAEGDSIIAVRNQGYRLCVPLRVR